MARTINGKPIQEVMEGITQPFNPSDFKINRYEYHYLPVEKYRQRLDGVVGIFNYDYETTEPQLCIVGTRPHIQLSGKITIKDDDGKPVVTKSASGGVQVIMSNKDNEAVLFKNDLKSATQDVFKNCCQALGMAENQLKQFRKDEKSHVNPDENPTIPLTFFRVTLKEAFSSIGKGKGYGAMVDIEGENEPRKLIIWQNAMQQIEKYMTMDKFLKTFKAKTTFCLYGYKSEFTPNNGPVVLQLTMDKPYFGEEGSENDG